MYLRHLMILLTLTLAVACEGLVDVAGENQVAGSVARGDNDGMAQRRLRSSATTAVVADGPDDEERVTLNVKAGFDKLKNLFKKNLEMTKTLQNVESIKFTSKEVL
ncbi:hypothetical protein PHYSODRAFT_288712 [Phytophthora sojae]|uniref:RxLR effector protein n=2 Tax=Phytophthora sojae TaxID=67593 RepID=G5A752_PHYSP|nr:hypothetical protein PHYSODRAFT_288712 [Phytophthora sojae]AEK81270.1 Avh373 [Phytophthora sojae]AEK81271.1 Avh373 [Phytophthora sojae]AEK81272.1 Avh373 [Phytophthora sojae]EGZ09157.1 hypothetical protein PHYSODRAFT_288712 [Phytophthora sojae]|eukprot:XP_009535790.1 hypothetical protein PHYSODRAFT_288712 [Phytophthora sojae]